MADALARLAEAEAGLRSTPDSIELLYERASLLRSLGRTEEARQAYLTLLTRDPSHFGGLVDFGNLLLDTGYRSAARTSYGRAVALFPDRVSGQVNLANLLASDGDLEAARRHYEAALRLDPTQAEAHRGLANLLTELGEGDAAHHHRQAGFAGGAIVTVPYRGEGIPIPVLMLVSSRNGNIQTRGLLDDRVFATSVLFADHFDPEGELPPHRLLFNAIGDADLCRDALEVAVRLAARSNAAIVNPPLAVLETGRAEIPGRLSGIPGLTAPLIEKIPKASLPTRQDLQFPLLIRSSGFHTGRHFLRIDDASKLPQVAELPGDELLTIQYLDARGSDGLHRKYRVMFIDGQLYPLHLAISRDWKVHYFTAGMADNPGHRAEETAFLEDPATVLGARAYTALERVHDILGLDYGGIDFGRDRDGNLLLFEANATMVINPPEPDPRWDYRRAPIQRALDAARHMLRMRAGG